jgi:Ca2+-binding EF-hand superfamily protein
MKNTHKALLVVTLAVSSFALQAGGMSFVEFDADNNGMVSEQEFNTAKNQRIASKAKEGRKMKGLANAPMFASIDVNRDGQLSAEEMQVMQKGHDKKSSTGTKRGKPPEPVFTDFDANGDNSLTEKEYNDARNKRIGDRAKEGRKMKGLANLASFANIDGNGDGKVYQDEFATFLAEHKRQGH